MLEPEREKAVQFTNSRGENLVGVWHFPNGKPRAAILMLHGWSGTRSGPHQMLTRGARDFCHAGFAVLRFDFAGRGDSEGDSDLATLATMKDDAARAMKWMKGQTDAPVILLGLCSGCEIAFASISNETDAVILWSAPIFAALPSTENASKKRGENLAKYARKLLAPTTWRKIMSGQVDAQNVSKALAGGGGAAHKNLESNEPGQLPPGFRERCVQNWKIHASSKPILLVYGGADPIYESASAWYASSFSKPAEIEIVPDANHSFYGLKWEREVFARTIKWLDNQPTFDTQTYSMAGKTKTVQNLS